MDDNMDDNDTSSTNTTTTPSSFCPGLSPIDLVREAKRQASRNCISYLLGLATCLLTVVTAATMQSLLGASPAVFLRQAEDGNGQVDVLLTGTPGVSLNFSAMAANVEASGAKDILTHMSPRIQLGLNLKIYTVAADEATTINAKRYFSTRNYGLAVDTARDKLAGIGRSWERSPLKLGQAWISSRLAKILELEMDDYLDVELDVYSFLSRYITLNDELTNFFTIQKRTKSPGIDSMTNQTIKGNKTKCLEVTNKKIRSTPRSNDGMKVCVTYISLLVVSILLF